MAAGSTNQVHSLNTLWYLVVELKRSPGNKGPERRNVSIHIPYNTLTTKAVAAMEQAVRETLAADEELICIINWSPISPD